MLEATGGLRGADGTRVDKVGVTLRVTKAAKRGPMLFITRRVMPAKITNRLPLASRPRQRLGRPTRRLGNGSECAGINRFGIENESVLRGKAKRVRVTLQKMNEQLRKRMHRPLGEMGRWLRSVVQGWLNYHAVPSNSHCLCRFVDEVTRLWLTVIRQRSQRGRSKWTWERMQRLVRLHLPRPRITHPYPNQRFCARLKAGAV